MRVNRCMFCGHIIPDDMTICPGCKHKYWMFTHPFRWICLRVISMMRRLVDRFIDYLKRE